MFQFAWVNSSETVFGPEHDRVDEIIVAVDLSHSEGDFAQLTIEVKNPKRYLLSGVTNIWAWLAWNNQPLFFGRLVAIPEDVSTEIVSLSFIARPPNFEDQKIALANSLKVGSYWDPIWIALDRLDDPDVVLESRPSLWHIDRLTHVLTISQIYAGEDGTIAYDGSDILYDSLSITYSSPPLRRVRVEATLSWDQKAEGNIDISQELVDAFAVAGSERAHLGIISSYTGQGLEADWPQFEKSLNGGWYIGEGKLTRVDGTTVSSRHATTHVYSVEPVTTEVEGANSNSFFQTTISVRFFIWEFRTVFTLDYKSSRQRIEKVNFNLEADMQAVFSEPGEDEVELITLSSRRLSDPIIPVEEVEGEPDPEEPLPELPETFLIYPERNDFLPTDRGRQSLEYLIMVARATLLARARAVEITVSVPFERGIDLSLRKSLHITDDRIPGGEASGKIISYTLSSSGGRMIATVTMGCMIGTGNNVIPSAGVASYVEADEYVVGYQFYTDKDYALALGDVIYQDFLDVEIPGFIDFGALTPEDIIVRLEVINGEAIQREVLRQKFSDVPAAITAMNEVFTEVWLELIDLTNGPFEVTYDINMSKLMVPRTITL